MKSGAWTAPLALLLPALFWLCHAQGWPLWIGGALLLPLAILQGRRHAWTLALAAAVLGAWALLARSDMPVRLYPVAISFTMLFVFGVTLWRTPTMIERFARLRRPELPPEAVAHCRRVTIAWCVFFCLNGAVALWTAVAASERVWALYNGGISYGLMGLMFAGEWLLRQRLIRRNEAMQDAGKTHA